MNFNEFKKHLKLELSSLSRHLPPGVSVIGLIICIISPKMLFNKDTIFRCYRIKHIFQRENTFIEQFMTRTQ